MCIRNHSFIFEQQSNQGRTESYCSKDCKGALKNNCIMFISSQVQLNRPTNILLC